MRKIRPSDSKKKPAKQTRTIGLSKVFKDIEQIRRRAKRFINVKDLIDEGRT